MPGVASNSGDLSLVTYSPNLPPPTVLSLSHGLKPPIARLSVSWSRGDTLRVTVLRPQSDEASDDLDPGGKVVVVSLSRNGYGEDSTWRRIVHGSVMPFEHLQSRRSTISNLSNISLGPSPYSID